MILCLTFFFISLSGFLYNIQDSLLYYPDNPPHSRTYVDLPSVLNLPYENIFVKVGHIVLNMYFIKQRPETLATAPTVIYFHGNAGNIGHRFVYIWSHLHVCVPNQDCICRPGIAGHGWTCWV